MRIHVAIAPCRAPFVVTLALSAQPPPPPTRVGREVAVPTHLQNGEEFTAPLAKLLAHGKLLFEANWTDQEGGGRPLTKGTGRPLADQSRPLTGARAFNRISGPDADSCAGCHNALLGIVGGVGDFVTNVFVLGQRFDAVTFDRADTLPTRGGADKSGRPASLATVANQRATTGLQESALIAQTISFKRSPPRDWRTFKTESPCR
jgi:hypothetical protein